MAADSPPSSSPRAGCRAGDRRAPAAPPGVPMKRPSRWARRCSLLAGLRVVVAALGCARQPGRRSASRRPSTSARAAAPSTLAADDLAGARRECEDRALAAASYRPPDDVPTPMSSPAGSFMAELRERGRAARRRRREHAGLLVPRHGHRRARGLRGRARPRDRQAALRRRVPPRRRGRGPGRHRREDDVVRDGDGRHDDQRHLDALRAVGGRRLQRRVLHGDPGVPRPP